MARNKRFNVHDLYPATYSFDSEAFYTDPEGYVFTSDDMAYFNAMELEQYELEVPMTYYEKMLLRKWVKEGHSPRENAGSKYISLSNCDCYDFLAVHRMDKEIRQSLKGMSKEEQKAYLVEYTGCTDTVTNQTDDSFRNPSEKEREHLLQQNK